MKQFNRVEDIQKYYDAFLQFDKQGDKVTSLEYVTEIRVWNCINCVYDTYKWNESRQVWLLEE